ncbi:MAG: hypothetical protein ACM3ML_23040 [Micromonosporaceae bacterium]
MNEPVRLRPRSWSHAERVAPHKRIRAVKLVNAIPPPPQARSCARVLIDADRGPTHQTAV